MNAPSLCASRVQQCNQYSIWKLIQSAHVYFVTIYIYNIFLFQYVFRFYILHCNQRQLYSQCGCGSGLWSEYTTWQNDYIFKPKTTSIGNVIHTKDLSMAQRLSQSTTLNTKNSGCSIKQKFSKFNSMLSHKYMNTIWECIVQKSKTSWT